MAFFAEPIARLIDELKRLPGIGPKTAQRLAFHILSLPQGDVERLGTSLTDARNRVKDCSVCFNLTDCDPCGVCCDASRDRSVICVVERPEDVLAMERTREFKGVYHVLGGAISPMDGIGPGDVRLKELVGRVRSGGITEVIVATDPNIEGEATAIYIARLLKPYDVKVTRIARGLPVGGDLEYADEVTLARALEGRRAI